MTAVLQQGTALDRHQSTSVFSFALLLSLALHVIAGGILTPFWLKAEEKITPPILVMLEAAPAPVTPVAVAQTEPHAHPHVRPAPKRPALPVTPVQHVPTPSPVTVERVEPAPVVQAPVVAPALPSHPVVVATAPASVTPAGKPQETPAHHDVTYLVKPQPAYPAMARRLGIEGLVLVRVQVGATGIPEQVSVAKTSGTNALDEEALRAVRESRFEPARRGDTPIAHVVEVPIRFRLKN